MTHVQPIAFAADAARGAETRISGLAIALVAVFLAVVAVFSPGVLGDGDTFIHVSAGDWILAHGAVPRVDPFSFDFAGRPWVAHEWLAEVLLALAFRLAGWSGVALLTAASASGPPAISPGRRCSP
jgi:hypothetical protein